MVEVILHALVPYPASLGGAGCGHYILKPLPDPPRIIGIDPPVRMTRIPAIPKFVESRGRIAGEVQYILIPLILWSTAQLSEGTAPASAFASFGAATLTRDHTIHIGKSIIGRPPPEPQQLCRQ